MTDQTSEPATDQTADARDQPAALPGVAGQSLAAVAAALSELGEPSFRARQVADAVWRSSAATWDDVTTLALPVRSALAERLAFDTMTATDVRVADGGLTEKALHRLADGSLIESVLMHYPGRGARRERNTLCISSQAGCAVGCPFCATGELGFGRDLSVAEIVDQVRHARRRLAAAGRHLTNLVFMGMGEPLLNLDAVLGAAEALTDPARYGLGARHITISTSGVVPGMERLAKLKPQWTLAVSLHAARNPLRDLLVPLNRRWPVERVVAAARDYARATGRRVSYEYVMIDGINDTPADADALAALLRGTAAHVNCIPMNPVAHTPWQASRPERVEGFASRLLAAGVGVTVRRNRGQEVGAACGQLAAERAGEPPAPEVARRRERLVEASAAALSGVAREAPAPFHVQRRAAPGGRGLPPTSRPSLSGRPRGAEIGDQPSPDGPRSPGRSRPPKGEPLMADGRARVAASILNSNLANLAHEVRKAVKAGADRIHLDVMDAHFVPNLTFGAGTIAALRPVTKSPFDAHLMIDEPGRWLDEYIEAGCDSITFHVEVDEPKEPTLRRIKAAGRAAGLAIKPATPLSALEPFRELIDIVMIMTVEPGFGGQTFMKDVALAKILRARDLIAHKPWGGEIHVDGGVSRETADVAGGQGADILIAGTALFAKGRDAGREIRLIKALADEAYSYEQLGGRPVEPRERMITFVTLPKHLALRLLDQVEAHGVPAVILRGNGQLNPDGVRDYDLLIPAEILRLGGGPLRLRARCPAGRGRRLAGRPAGARHRLLDPGARRRAAGAADAAPPGVERRPAGGGQPAPAPPNLTPRCGPCSSASRAPRSGSTAGPWAGSGGASWSCWAWHRPTTRRRRTRSRGASSSCASTRTRPA